MTTSPAASPSLPAPGGVPLTLPGDAKSAAAGQSTADFFKIISQAYRQRQDDAAAAQRQQDATAASSSAPAAATTSETTPDSATAAKTDSKSASTKKKTDNPDATVSSMAMALMLPQTLAASEKKFIAAKAASSQGGQVADAIANDPGKDLARGMEWLAGKNEKLTVAADTGKAMGATATAAKITSAENSALVAAVEKKGLLTLSEKPQGVVDKTGKLLLKGFEGVANGDGAGVASLKERMKFATEKNEIAEPGDKSSTAVTSISSADGGASSDLSGDTDSDLAGGKKETVEPVMNLDFSAKAASFTVEHNSTETIQPAQVAAHVERVAHLVNQEAMTIRQSGAASVAVSLKLDAKTEISLELTNRNGQVQAAIRVEKGDLSGLAGHWGDLQESLAKQNVQLAEFDGKASNNFFPGGDPGSSPQDQSSLFGGTPQESRFQNRGLTNELAATATSTKPATQTKTKSPAQGWESWA